jgi:hypothetical protein
MKTSKIAILILLFVLPTPVFFNSCSQAPTEKTQPLETDIGNPLVEVKVGKYNMGAQNFSPFEEANAAITSLTWCFQIMHLRPKGDDKFRVFLHFTRDEVPLTPNGTHIEDLPIPDGTYDLIAIELKDNCLPNKKSVQVTNNNGSFSINDQTFLMLDGDVTVSGPGSEITFNIQNFVHVLNDVTDDSQIKPFMQSVRGEFY